MTLNELIARWATRARRHEDAADATDLLFEKAEGFLHLEIARVLRSCIGELNAEMKLSMDKEIAQLGRKSDYQEGYREGWMDALRATGVIHEDVMPRLEREITEIAAKMGGRTNVGDGT